MDLEAALAQDAPLARWSLAMRADRATDEAVRETLDSGAVIRTHVGQQLPPHRGPPGG